MKNKFLLLAVAALLSSSVAFAGNQAPVQSPNNDHVSSQVPETSNKKVHKKAGKHANHKKNKKTNK